MNTFRLLPPLATRARRSAFWLAVLNLALYFTVPFNRPHRFRLLELGADTVRTTGSYRRSNHNHIRGIHACAIATVAEFSAGFLLLTTLDPARYRLIMGRLEVDYAYQAKERIISVSTLDAQRLQREVLEPLATQESVTVPMESVITDTAGNHVARAVTTWQIKRWDRVRTQL